MFEKIGEAATELAGADAKMEEMIDVERYQKAEVLAALLAAVNPAIDVLSSSVPKEGRQASGASAMIGTDAIPSKMRRGVLVGSKDLQLASSSSLPSDVRSRGASSRWLFLGVAGFFAASVKGVLLSERDVLSLKHPTPQNVWAWYVAEFVDMSPEQVIEAGWSVSQVADALRDAMTSQAKGVAKKVEVVDKIATTCFAVAHLLRGIK